MKWFKHRLNFGDRASSGGELNEHHGQEPQIVKATFRSMNEFDCENVVTTASVLPPIRIRTSMQNQRILQPPKKRIQPSVDSQINSSNNNTNKEPESILKPELPKHICEFIVQNHPFNRKNMGHGTENLGLNNGSFRLKSDESLVAENSSNSEAKVYRDNVLHGKKENVEQHKNIPNGSIPSRKNAFLYQVPSPTKIPHLKSANNANKEALKQSISIPVLVRSTLEFDFSETIPTVGKAQSSDLSRHNEFQSRKSELKSEPNELQSRENELQRPDEHQSWQNEYQSRPNELQSQPDEHQSWENELQSRPDEHQSRSDEHQSWENELQSRPVEHQSRPDEHQSRPDEHQSRSDEHQSLENEHQSRPNEHQSRPNELQSRPDEHQSRPNELQSRPDERQSRPGAHQSSQNKHQLKQNEPQFISRTKKSHSVDSIQSTNSETIEKIKNGFLKFFTSKQKKDKKIAGESSLNRGKQNEEQKNSSAIANNSNETCDDLQQKVDKNKIEKSVKLKKVRVLKEAKNKPKENSNPVKNVRALHVESKDTQLATELEPKTESAVKLKFKKRKEHLIKTKSADELTIQMDNPQEENVKEMSHSNELFAPVPKKRSIINIPPEQFEHPDIPIAAVRRTVPPILYHSDTDSDSWNLVAQHRQNTRAITGSQIQINSLNILKTENSMDLSSDESIEFIPKPRTMREMRRNVEETPTVKQDSKNGEVSILNDRKNSEESDTEA